MTDWAWVTRDVVLAIHDEQLAEHGGATGVRDPGALDSALARPLNLVAYGAPDVAALAAAYAFGLAKNHAFVDGNKRTAFVVAEVFLDLNGFTLLADDADCVLTMLRLAASDLDEAGFADWLRRNSPMKVPGLPNQPQVPPTADLSIEEILDLDECGIPRSPYNESLNHKKNRTPG